MSMHYILQIQADSRVIQQCKCIHTVHSLPRICLFIICKTALVLCLP